MTLPLGNPICIETRRYQRRKHHKKRINKKWAKRYGWYEINLMPHDKVVMYDGAIHMTQKPFNDFVKLMPYLNDYLVKM